MSLKMTGSVFVMFGIVVATFSEILSAKGKS